MNKNVQPASKPETIAPYDAIFSAIRNATEAQTGKAITVSVAKFKESLAEKGYGVLPLTRCATSSKEASAPKAVNCREAGPGKGLCIECANGNYERCLYVAAQSAQPFRDDVLERCAASFEKFFGRNEKLDVGYVIDSIRTYHTQAPVAPTAAPSESVQDAKAVSFDDWIKDRVFPQASLSKEQWMRIGWDAALKSKAASEPVQAVTLTELDAAFNEEIKRVGGLQSKSDDVCRWFYDNIKKRLLAGSAKTATAEPKGGEQ